MSGAFNFDLHALKRIDYIGVTFRTRMPEEVREIVRLMRADLWPAVESGQLSLPIEKTFPLEKNRRCLGDDARQWPLREDRHYDVRRTADRAATVLPDQPEQSMVPQDREGGNGMTGRLD